MPSPRETLPRRRRHRSPHPPKLAIPRAVLGPRKPASRLPRLQLRRRRPRQGHQPPWPPADRAPRAGHRAATARTRRGRQAGSHATRTSSCPSQPGIGECRGSSSRDCPRRCALNRSSRWHPVSGLGDRRAHSPALSLRQTPLRGPIEVSLGRADSRVSSREALDELVPPAGRSCSAELAVSALPHLRHLRDAARTT
jgi:hypothetical protein